jgi:hypothetical protein
MKGREDVSFGDSLFALVYGASVTIYRVDLPTPQQPKDEGDMIKHYFSRSQMILNDLICLFNYALIGTSLCVLRTHIESRFCNPHVLILLN